MRSHPRPQLTRAHWIDLDGTWQFASDPDDHGLNDRWWEEDREFDRTIIVPFPPESPASGVGETTQRIVWYKKIAEIRRPTTTDRVVLHFGAVDYQADVWVNGEHVTTHLGGHTSFSVDITTALSEDGQQAIVVRALDEPDALDQPRGKQDWESEPHTIWYRRTTGIWRQVWAEIVPATHIARLRWTSLTKPGQLRVEAFLNRPLPGSAITISIWLDGDLFHEARLSVSGGEASAILDLRDARFDSEPDRLQWTPERPTLFDARVSLEVDGTSIDSIGSYFGLRTVGTSAGHFLLNERPYFLRLALEQAYWPQSHLAAPSDEAIRREAELIKELGFNGIRMHQTVSDPRFLFECDRLGLVVWADAPAAYRFSDTALRRTLSEWMDIVQRDASHPSVIAWVAFNESWGVPDVATSTEQQNAVLAAHHLLKALDPSRLVIGNDGWEYVAGDVLGVHDYTQSPATVDERYGTRERAVLTVLEGRPGARTLRVDTAEGPVPPIVLSEFGGTSFSSREATWNGYGTVCDVEQFVDRVEKLVASVARAGGLAGFCYTQLTDTMQERNGLLDEDRQPKAPIERLRSAILGS